MPASSRSGNTCALRAVQLWVDQQCDRRPRSRQIHDQLPSDVAPDLYGGWPMLLSGLKTWLETGTTLTTPGSLMYQPDQNQETTS